VNSFIKGHKLRKKTRGGQSRHVRSRGDTVTIAENSGSDGHPGASILIRSSLVNEPDLVL